MADEPSEMQLYVTEVLLRDHGIKADPMSIFLKRIEEPKIVESENQVMINISFTYHEGATTLVGSVPPSETPEEEAASRERTQQIDADNRLQRRLERERTKREQKQGRND